MFRETGRRDPEALTEADVIRWVTGQYGGHRVRNSSGELANNTVRQRMATAREFLAYCARRGLVVVNVDAQLAKIRKQYPRTYGKAQDKNAARRLSRDEAFGPLLRACQDRTWRGSRDQLAIRLGLIGIRVNGIVRLTWGNLDGNRLAWQDKGRRINTRTLGPILLDLLARWRQAYEKGLGRPVERTDPIICSVRGSLGRLCPRTAIPRPMSLAVDGRTADVRPELGCGAGRTRRTPGRPMNLGDRDVPIVVG